jgi:hypothetical protein
MIDKIDMNIEQEILQIKGRNKKVEADKAWERSWARRLSISVFTYIVAEAWLLIIREPNSWYKAFVPVVGYILSTLTLPPIKKFWIKNS